MCSFRNPGDAFSCADKDLIGFHPSGPLSHAEGPFTFLGVTQGTGKRVEIEGVGIGVEIGA